MSLSLKDIQDIGKLVWDHRVYDSENAYKLGHLIAFESLGRADINLSLIRYDGEWVYGENNPPSGTSVPIATDRSRMDAETFAREFLGRLE